MAQPYSDDFRQKVMEAIELNGFKKSEVSQMFNISRNTINLWFQRRAETGDVKPKPRPTSSPTAKITDWEKFQNFVKEHGDKTQSEMAELWEGEISQRTLSRALEKIGHSRKKTYGYSQRDEAKRADFIAQLEDAKAPHLIYVDESGRDERDNYGYGYSPVGERFYDLKSGRRQGRVNMIAGYRNGQLIAPFTIEGACNRTVFETWLETCLIPVLQPGEWVIVDNATFHHGGRIAQLIKQAGCKLVYLPPYSPDLNRIEKCWAWLKSRIRKLLRDSDNLRDAMESVLKQAAS
ncbi:MAG: IS630 family transposase [Drouetiella hepatica Uher 2000/2452]|uniref:IS630 family transposase n=1 Tax=Drouetiella hepatica Uher 2000/2452 TaxID=904376 RepID=A0A951UPE6_9CYAN|nr:IS630 family transposase [Drouetiella hepatica Uher 2000/2452]